MLCPKSLNCRKYGLKVVISESAKEKANEAITGQYRGEPMEIVENCFGLIQNFVIELAGVFHCGKDAAY